MYIIIRMRKLSWRSWGQEGPGTLNPTKGIDHNPKENQEGCGHRREGFACKCVFFFHRFVLLLCFLRLKCVWFRDSFAKTVCSLL